MDQFSVNSEDSSLFLLHITFKNLRQNSIHGEINSDIWGQYAELRGKYFSGDGILNAHAVVTSGAAL